jgi:hypothetical protein
MAPQVQGASELQKAKNYYERAGCCISFNTASAEIWELLCSDLGGGTGCQSGASFHVKSNLLDLCKSASG